MSIVSSALKVVIHPIFIFVASQVVWVVVAILWVHWFVNAREIIQVLKSSFPPGIESHITITTLIIGCVLLGMILVGSIWIFVVSQRQSLTLKQQQNFVSSVTHELRSPLASLKLMIETAEARRLPFEMQSQLLSMAKKDIERLLRLVNQILLSSRLDRGVEDFSKSQELLDIKTIVSQSGERAAWLDQNIQDRIFIQCPEGLSIQASKSGLMLIFGNLIENAIKYSPLNSPIIIEIFEKSNFIVVSIKDQGFGITSADLKRIFKLFHRGQVAASKAIPGTGVGLFLVKSIVKILGGRISVFSEGVGKGSTFTVELPMRGQNEA
jgi:signal transduction histidine kinase